MNKILAISAIAAALYLAATFARADTWQYDEIDGESVADLAYCQRADVSYADCDSAYHLLADCEAGEQWACDAYSDLTAVQVAAE